MTTEKLLKDFRGNPNWWTWCFFPKYKLLVFSHLEHVEGSMYSRVRMFLYIAYKFYIIFAYTVDFSQNPCVSCTAGVQISAVLRKGSIGTSAFAEMIEKATSDFFWIKTVGIHQGSLNGTYTDVSESSGFSPQIIHFNRVFHYQPSILGYPYFWKHPYWRNQTIQQYCMAIVSNLLPEHCIVFLVGVCIMTPVQIQQLSEVPSSCVFSSNVFFRAADEDSTWNYRFKCFLVQNSQVRWSGAKPSQAKTPGINLT